jgi:hypothetical protein
VRKAKIGDIFEIKTPIGLAYVQYTHDGEDMGELVRVLPGVYSSRPSDFATVAKQKEMYFIFYTLEYALRAKQVEIVSKQPVPEWARQVPIMRKAGGMTDREGRTLNWTIGPALKLSTIEDLKQALHVRGLTPEQEKLSIALLRSHPSMVEKIAKGWTPERDEELNLAAWRNEKETSAQASEQQNSIDHYLYFPKKSQAEKAEKRLKAKGWSVEIRLGADGENWLALAKQPVPIEDIEEVRDELERLTEELGGEYDGWGAAVTDGSNLQ